MLMRVDRWDVRRDGPFSETAMLHKLRSFGYEPLTHEYPAGAIMSRQADSRQRIQAVISGLIKVTIDGEAAILRAGDLVVVPRDTLPRVEVLGPSRATCLEAALGPRTP
jgi:quercetin dioxygenase-like cupin family protein